jgi:hypothetical protein
VKPGVHFVVLAGNAKEYGGGRVDQKLFECYDVPVLALEDFPGYYISECILSPIFSVLPGSSSSSKAFEAEKMRLLEKYAAANALKPESMTVRELQQEALGWALDYLDSLDSLGHPKSLERSGLRLSSTTLGARASAGSSGPSSAILMGRQGLKGPLEGDLEVSDSKRIRSSCPALEASEPLVIAPYMETARAGLEKALKIKQGQKMGRLASDGIGLNGVMIAGPPGVGKSDLVTHILIKLRIDFIRIEANLELSQKKKMLLEAFNLGMPVVVEEIDSCCDDGLEKVLNALLTGVDLDGKKASSPGFIFIGTLNGAGFEGRSCVSPALIHRCVQLKIERPSDEDIQKILCEKYQHKFSESSLCLVKEVFLSLQASEGYTLRELMEFMKTHESASYSAVPMPIFSGPFYDGGGCGGAGSAVGSGFSASGRGGLNFGRY